ncbi:MAG: hypothetical protein IT190_07605 [Microbacteriaceae bacterium]|nr:hypothetical protein [Microbacteriaceae bacterium]
MNLFGNLFGASGSSSVMSGDLRPLTIEFIELAIELIDEAIPTPNAVWVSISSDAVDDVDEPWKTVQGQSTEYPVRLLFTLDALEDRQLLKYLKHTEANDGQVNGLMYRTDFEPTLKDIVKWNNQELVVRAINPITPIDGVIIYVLEFGT